MLGKKMKHFQRYQELVNACMRNGFSFAAEEVGLTKMFSLRKKWDAERAEAGSLPLGARIRHTLQELGPTFIKLGQLASTRPDLVPPNIMHELEKLQEQVPPFPYEEAKAILESELNGTLGDIFAEFDDVPLASASIGQVYRAVLPNGEAVAVKIQRPDIRSAIEIDLEIAMNLARLLEKRFSWAAAYHLVDMMSELTASLLKELDYEREARNTERIRRQMREHARIVVPAVHPEYCTKKVLTLDYIDGISIGNAQQLDEQLFDLSDLADHFVQSILHQIFIDGFFHADPHPGNILVLPGGTVGMIDFGLVGRLDSELRYHFSSMIIAMARQDSEGVLKAILNLGIVPTDVQMPELKADIEDMEEKYVNRPFGQMSIGEMATDLFSVAHKHRIEFPSDFALLGKTMLTMEGIVKKLDPGYNMLAAAEPLGKELIRRRYHPSAVADRLWESGAKYAEVMGELPVSVRDLARLIQKGKLRLQITIPQLDSFLKKMDKVGNRLSYSIVLLSFSIIMSGLIIGSSIVHQANAIWKLPVLEIGFGIAAIMVLWLLYSIIRSGKL